MISIGLESITLLSLYVSIYFAFLGPLAKRIKTKHMQEIALSGSVTLTPSVSNPVAVEQDNMASAAGPSSVSSHQSSPQQEQPGIQQGSSSHHQESQELSDQQGTSPNPIAGSSSQAKKSAKPSTSQPERQQSVAEEIRLPPLGDDNQLSIAQQQGKFYVFKSSAATP